MIATSLDSNDYKTYETNVSITTTHNRKVFKRIKNLRGKKFLVGDDGVYYTEDWIKAMYKDKEDEIVIY